MNTGQLKAISWTLAVVFGAGLAGYVGYYLTHQAELEKRVAPETIRETLAKVPPIVKKAEDIVAYDRVNATFYKHNWTAKAPPKIEPTVPAPAPPKPSEMPVAKLVKVLLVKADSTDATQSRAVLKYQPPAQVTLKDPTVVKHVGDALDAPNEWISVHAILPEGVQFKFANANREMEIVGPDEFQHRLDLGALAGDSTRALLNQPEVRFPRTLTAGQVPVKTQQIGEGTWQIGTEDLQDWDQNYQQYLAEVEFDRHRDPQTGKYDGIALTNVPANSVAAAHGAKTGDVIKSINGHPVNSTQEAIAFVKNNKDKYDVWEVVIESKGKSKTLVYKVPKNN